MGLAAGGFDLRGDLLPRLLLNVGNHDRRSFGGETPGGGGSDAVGGPRNQGPFFRESSWVASLLGATAGLSSSVCKRSESTRLYAVLSQGPASPIVYAEALLDKPAVAPCAVNRREEGCEYKS